MPVGSHPEFVHTLIALAIVSFTSLIGSASFALGKRLMPAVPFLVSAATGALLGTALCNLLPESVERLHSSRRVGLFLTLGFLLSFVLERLLGMVFQKNEASHIEHLKAQTATVGGALAPESVVRDSSEEASELAELHHGHEHSRLSGKPLVTNVLLSGAVHSLVDGVGIAAAFAFSHAAGVATTIAVLLHEVPHHIADVGVLIYSGIPKGRAILLNLLATTGCAMGGILVLMFGSTTEFLTSTLLPLTAANFLYIAVGMLMPELQLEKNRSRSALQMASLVATVALIFILSRYLPEQSPNSSVAQLLK